MTLSIYSIPNKGGVNNTPGIKMVCDDAQASIYYTIDGSTPTSSSTLYENDIDYPRLTLIKAIAIKEGEQTEVQSYQCSIPIAYTSTEKDLIINNSVDFLGGYSYFKSITFGPSGKVYNCKLYNSMLYPIGLDLSNHVVKGYNYQTDYQYWTNFVEGQVVYDKGLKKMKLYNGTAWVNLDGTPLS